MDPIRNPFSPGAGTPPPELVGRGRILEQAEILFGRTLFGRPEKSLMLTGLRGVGKTVLLCRLEQMAKEKGFLTIFAEAGENDRVGEFLVQGLRKILLDLDFSAKAKEKIRKAGGEVTVYNPPGYRYTESPTLARGNYWWLWKNRISYVYQWVVNCWSEHGYTGWDDYRYASWIAPGPEGPLSTLRLSATRDGIEDYEYLTLLRKTIPEIRKSNPELAEQGERLLQRVSETAGRGAASAAGFLFRSGTPGSSGCGLPDRLACDGGGPCRQ